MLLEQQRFSNNFNFSIDVDPELEPDWTEIPPMLIQPYVENAVLHGMEHKNGDGFIRVSYGRESERLRITIDDNGPGIFTTQAYKAANPSPFRHKSAGMTITQKRLEIINDSEYKVEISEPKNEAGKVLGTHISVLI